MTNQQAELTKVINLLPEYIKHWLDESPNGYELVLDVDGQFHTVTFDGKRFSITHVKEKFTSVEDVIEMLEVLVAERDFENTAFTLNGYRSAKAKGFKFNTRHSEVF